MPKQSSSKKDDFQEALRSAEQAIGAPLVQRKKRKNPAAVALGRLGGLKGGKARAEELTPERRKAIAQQAAQARWAKDK
jgi:hypothetical protein